MRKLVRFFVLKFGHPDMSPGSIWCSYFFKFILEFKCLYFLNEVSREAPCLFFISIKVAFTSVRIQDLQSKEEKGKVMRDYSDKELLICHGLALMVSNISSFTNKIFQVEKDKVALSNGIISILLDGSLAG